MGLHSYLRSIELNKHNYPFYTLIMSAMRKADSINIELLKEAFPDIYEELDARYNAPGGRIGDEVDYG